MALLVPLSYLDFPGQLFDNDGNPLASGWLTFYAAGTTTPQDTFADVNGDATNANPLQLDSAGRYTVFLSPTLYDIVVSSYEPSTPLVPGPELYTREGIGNPGAIVFAQLGNIQQEGSRAVADNYIILSTDNLVTTPTGAIAQTMFLPAAADRSSVNNGNGFPIIVQNYLSATCTVELDGSDTANGDTAAIVIPAASGATKHWAAFYSDGSSAWIVLTA